MLRSTAARYLLVLEVVHHDCLVVFLGLFFAVLFSWHELVVRGGQSPEACGQPVCLLLLWGWVSWPLQECGCPLDPRLGVGFWVLPGWLVAVAATASGLCWEIPSWVCSGGDPLSPAPLHSLWWAVVLMMRCWLSR